MLALSAMAGAQTGKYPQTIVFMTDFGVVDDSVAICRGVMYSIMPAVRIVDVTHQVTPFSILDGARFLYGATPYFPAGTVFVVVIDPTVGSTRKAIVAKAVPIIVDDTPFEVLYILEDVHAYNSDLTGWHPNNTTP